MNYVESWKIFLDDSGQYSGYLPDSTGRTVLMRSTDGIHLTADGGMHLARVVQEIIQQDWHPG